MNSVGITDPISYISRMQLNKELIALTTCSVGPKILDDVYASIEEAIASGTWIDIMVCFYSFYLFFFFFTNFQNMDIFYVYLMVYFI